MRAAELAFDVVTAVLSLADIGLDLAVAIEFHNAGRSTYFQLSIAIFLLAQASYAFLFVATYGAELSNRRKVYSFLLALPFAQAVPVFTLIESFHFNFISNGLRSFGLRPTGSPAPAPRPCTGGGGGTEDSLWVLVQRKYHAHAGFLAEALLEALPQCALQVSAAVHAGESSWLNILSILFSLAVIASKGWLAAYSLHRPTFIFNSLCIAADVAGCFATASWLAIWQLSAATATATVVNATNTSFNATTSIATWTTLTEGPLPQIIAPGAAQLSAWWVSLVGAAIICGVAGSFGTVIFSMADDHLKALDPSIDTGISVDSVAFNIWWLRSCAWTLSLLPCATLLVLLHLSLLPLLAFKSLSSEHATYHTFFVALFSFLHGDDAAMDVPAAASSTLAPIASASRVASSMATSIANCQPSPTTAASSTDSNTATGSVPAPLDSCGANVAPLRPNREARLEAANHLIALALDHVDDLNERLSHLRPMASTAEQERVLKAWLATLGKRRTHIALMPSPAPPFPDARDTRFVYRPAQVTLSPPPPSRPRVESLGRWRRRLSLARYQLAHRRQRWQVELSRRSEVFRRLLGHGSSSRGSRSDSVLLVVALVGLALALFAAVPAALLTLVLVPFGTLYPLVQLGLSLPLVLDLVVADNGLRLGQETSALSLPWALTGVFALLMLLLLLLLPVVQRFQMLRVDLLPTAGLPPTFFSPSVVAEIRRRLERQLRKKSAVLSVVRGSEVHECCVCMASIHAEDGSYLDPCGHLFHTTCILTWLKEQASCPLCRTRADQGEVSMLLDGTPQQPNLTI